MTPVRIVNREVLPVMGRPMMAVFIVRNVLQGNFHLAENFFDDALAQIGSGAAPAWCGC